jgi:hypothetical protein
MPYMPSSRSGLLSLVDSRVIGFKGDNVESGSAKAGCEAFKMASPISILGIVHHQLMLSYLAYGKTILTV